MEIELKLLIEPSAVAAFRRHPAIRRCALAAPQTQHLVSIYFDTADRALRRRGLVWRVRRVGRGWVQTIKADGDAVSGLHRRPEWESPVAGPRPDLAAFVPLPEGLAALTGDLATIQPALAPSFRSDLRRTVWRLRLPEGSAVELALDRGVLRAGDRERPLCEAELELDSGDPAALFDFALELAERVPLRVGYQSKAERGFALEQRRVNPAVKSQPVGLASDLTLEAAFGAIVGSCLAQVQANEAGVIEGGDADCLHQMRVGLRRLRTALRLFRRWIGLPPSLQQGLDRLAAVLGAARDAEVLAGDTLSHVLAGAAHDPALYRLHKALGATAAAQHRRAAALIAGADHARLSLGLGAWLHGRRWRESIDPEAAVAIGLPVGAAADRILVRCRKRLAAADPGAGPVLPEQRHAVRIAAKRLRYAIEFFAGLYPPERTRRTLVRLVALQDELGWLNDVAVADAALRQLARSRPALAEAAAFARGFLHADAQRAADQWPALLRECLDRRAPWR